MSQIATMFWLETLAILVAPRLCAPMQPIWSVSLGDLDSSAASWLQYPTPIAVLAIVEDLRKSRRETVRPIMKILSIRSKLPFAARRAVHAGDYHENCF
jgi:hypothetical protein